MRAASQKNVSVVVMRRFRLQAAQRKRAHAMHGFASGAAAAFILLFTFILGEFAVRRITREIQVMREKSLETMTVSKGQSYHRLLCRHIASGDFPTILAHHTQSRLEHPRRGNNIPLLFNNIDPLGADADIFFNVVYLMPTPPPAFTAEDYGVLPPAARLLMDEYNRFRQEGLIHLKYVATNEESTPESGAVSFSYIVEATVKTKIESAPAGGETAGARQEHQSRFLLSVSPARPQGMYGEPRPFYTPPYPALFAF